MDLDEPPVCFDDGDADGGAVRWVCLASMQMTGSLILFNSVHSHVDVAPVSSPIRATCGAFDLMNAAIASGSE